MPEIERGGQGTLPAWCVAQQRFSLDYSDRHGFVAILICCIVAVRMATYIGTANVDFEGRLQHKCCIKL